MKENTAIDVSVVMPALNEAKNIEAAVNNSLKAFDEFKISGEIVVVDDGSRDDTLAIVQRLAAGNNRVKVLSHDSPEGIGFSFWDGVDCATGATVVMLPGDNENDPWEIFRYYRLMEHVDIVIPFVFNNAVRPLFRSILSYIYRVTINTTFGVNFNYTNGTVLYRRSMLLQSPHRSSGFFFQTDILVRAVKKGYLFAEVPYRLGARKEGISKAVSFPSLVNVVKGYLNLVRDFYFKHNIKPENSFTGDSSTACRRK